MWWRVYPTVKNSMQKVYFYFFFFFVSFQCVGGNWLTDLFNIQGFLTNSGVHVQSQTFKMFVHFEHLLNDEAGNGGWCHNRVIGPYYPHTLTLFMILMSKVRHRASSIVHKPVKGREILGRGFDLPAIEIVERFRKTSTVRIDGVGLSKLAWAEIWQRQID